jgi:2'-5' RNA ligase
MEDPFSTQSGLGVLPPTEICESIDAWRKAYDPSYPVVAPHITLAYPPFVSQERWAAFSLALAECLADFAPFKVVLAQVYRFDGSPNILWLKPEDGGALTRIRRVLEKQFPGEIQRLPFRFQPHLTIGQFEELGALEEARAKVTLELKPLQFEVDRVYYVGLSPDGGWRTRDYLRLGR